jgi:hypothetical protein
MQIVGPPMQVHAEKQPHQPEVMVTVQVADEDVVDPVYVRLQLH